jgi:large subunit ribosomal protein L22
MKTTQKYIRTSPRKLRLVADAVRKLSPTEALRQLKFIGKRAAEPVYHAIKQAVSNAKNNQGLKEDQLRFKTLEINEGATYKRFRAVSRGMAHSIMKRSSHIRVVLEEKNGPKS